VIKAQFLVVRAKVQYAFQVGLVVQRGMTNGGGNVVARMVAFSNYVSVTSPNQKALQPRQKGSAQLDLSPDAWAVSAGLRAIKRGAQSEEIVGLTVKSRAAFAFISTYACMHVPIATSRQGYNVVQ
jgi:hypothetical protein